MVRLCFIIESHAVVAWFSKSSAVQNFEAIAGEGKEKPQSA